MERAIMKKIVFLLIAFACCGNAHAKAMDGNMALAFCKDSINCALIASSYSDGFSYALMALHTNNTIFCLPAGASTGVLGRIFKRYLVDNPEKLHYTAASLAVNAFSEAFPCDKQAN